MDQLIATEGERIVTEYQRETTIENVRFPEHDGIPMEFLRYETHK